MVSMSQQQPKGPWILVTGANRGVGYEIVKALLLSSQNVLLVARTEEAGEAAAKKLLAETGSAAACVPLSVVLTSTASIDKLVATVEQRYAQQIVAVINNAGIAVEGWTKAAFDDSMQVNYHACVQLSVKLVPFMSPGGTIVMVSTGWAREQYQSPEILAKVKAAQTIEQLDQAVSFDPQDKLMREHKIPGYVVSKFCLARATQILAQAPELKRKRLTINAVNPGRCSTAMTTWDGRDASLGAKSIMLTLLECLSGGAPPNGQNWYDGGEVPW